MTAKMLAAGMLAGGTLWASVALAVSPHPIADLTPIVDVPTGKSSTWVEITRDAVWVGSLQPNVLHRLDLKSRQMVATVELPGNPCSGLAAGLGSLWVPLCGASPSLAKVDLATNKVTAVYPMGPPAPEGGIAVSRDSVWMVTDKMGSLARINPNDGSVRQVVQLPADSYNPIYSRGRIWITQAKGATVTAVDAKTGKIVGTVETGVRPRFLTAGDGSIWTLDAGDGTVSRIDEKTLKRTQTISLGIQARGGDIKYDHDLVWITVLKTPLTVIDARSGKLLCQWVGAGGDSMGAGDGTVWLSNNREQSLTGFSVHDALSHCNGSSAGPG